MATYYAWSELRNGGKVDEVVSPTGATKTVVVERNTIAPGSKVKKSDFSDEEWDALIDGGSVRPYPMPDDANEYTSPTQAVLSKLSSGGDIDQNMILELALTQPLAANPPAEEGAEVPEGV